MKSGKCKFCEAPSHGNTVSCIQCRELVELTMKIRKLKRKVPKIACRRILMEVKYLEVLKALGMK